jgi:hypothetical protein
MNRKGHLPEKLVDANDQPVNAEKPSNDYGNVVGQDSLTRFDKPRDNNRRNRNQNKRRPRPSEGQSGEQVQKNQPQNVQPHDNENQPRRENQQRRHIKRETDQEESAGQTK